jgi:uncharacterized protein YjbI with pentapeptide repeats
MTTGEIREATDIDVLMLLKRYPDEISNLKLTSNHRIIESKRDKLRLTDDNTRELRFMASGHVDSANVHISFQVVSQNNFQNMLTKLKMCGVQYKELNNKAVAFFSGNNLNVVSTKPFYLTNNSTFHEFECASIDLRNTCPDELSDASEYFDRTSAKEIYINWENIPYLTSLYSTFAHSRAKVYGLETINTSNVSNFKDTFLRNTNETLDISRWNLRKASDMDSMFFGAVAKNIIIGNHPETKGRLDKTTSMFQECKCTALDLRGLDFSNTKESNYMFFSTIAQQGIYLDANKTLNNIDLKSSDFYGVVHTFNGLKSKVIINVSSPNIKRFMEAANIDSLDGEIS